MGWWGAATAPPGGGPQQHLPGWAGGGPQQLLLVGGRSSTSPDGLVGASSSPSPMTSSSPNPPPIHLPTPPWRRCSSCWDESMHSAGSHSLSCWGELVGGRSSWGEEAVARMGRWRDTEAAWVSASPSPSPPPSPVSFHALLSCGSVGPSAECEHGGAVVKRSVQQGLGIVLITTPSPSEPTNYCKVVAGE